ncbi:MAG: pantetheine-phosphate adenylyltransferase [Gammaproteobacteria bacterium AqS3]|nr:pantetheine-phosphate adenylyltransferase [Gammaproteobacteria bacterium AqS3]
MTKALYPGTFDPITLGHTDLIQRALGVFDQITLAIAKSEAKKPIFSLEERIEMARELFADRERVEVVSFTGLMYKFAEEVGASIVLRGVRTTTDFEYELQLASMNRTLKRDLETVFLTPDVGLSHISSTLVREIAKFGGEVSQLVPPSVEARLREKLGSG